MEFLLKWLKNAIVIFIEIFTVTLFLNMILGPVDSLLTANDIIIDFIIAIVLSFMFTYEPLKKFLEKPLFISNKK